MPRGPDRVLLLPARREGPLPLQFKANLNKLLADRRASVAGRPRINERVCTAIREVFAAGAGIERIYFPDKPGDIPDRPALALAVMGPDRPLTEAGTKSLLEVMAREHGQSSRVFKSGVIWCVAEDTGTLRDEARKLLAWEDILGDRDDLKLDEQQAKSVKENIHKAKGYLTEAVWQAYKNVFLLEENNELRRIDLGKIHSSAAPSIVELVLGRLQQVDLLTDIVSVNTLVNNWPPALPEWTTKSLRDAFYASPKFPRITSPDVVKATIAKGVTEKKLAYAGKTGDKYEPIIFQKPLTAGDVDFGDDFIVVRAQDAERIFASPEHKASVSPSRPPTPSRPPPPKSSTTPPPPSVRLIPGFTWEGEVPWRSWTHFYSKVISRFSTKGVKLRVAVEVAPAGGVTEQEIEETRMALKELGLEDGVKTRIS